MPIFSLFLVNSELENEIALPLASRDKAVGVTFNKVLRVILLDLLEVRRIRSGFVKQDVLFSSKFHRC